MEFKVDREFRPAFRGIIKTIFALSVNVKSKGIQLVLTLTNSTSKVENSETGNKVNRSQLSPMIHCAFSIFTAPWKGYAVYMPLVHKAKLFLLIWTETDGNSKANPLKCLPFLSYRNKRILETYLWIILHKSWNEKKKKDELSKGCIKNQVNRRSHQQSTDSSSAMIVMPKNKLANNLDMFVRKT